MTTYNSGPYSPPLPQDPNHVEGHQSGYTQQSSSEGYPFASPPAYGQKDDASYTQPDEGYNEPDVFAKICPEDPDKNGFDFSEQSIRRGFLRKVYSILMVQLLITAAVISFFIFEPRVKGFVQENSWLLFVAIGVLFVAVIALACGGEVRRKAPANYLLLAAYTLAMAFVLGAASSTYGRDEVLMAVGITVVLCLALTLFAFQTRIDFTMCGGVLFVALLMLFIFSIIASVMAATGNMNRIVNLVFASLGALLFSVYLIYDTQLMMGGRHKYSISPEEYIFAALNLYVDIANIFLYVLRALR